MSHGFSFLPTFAIGLHQRRHERLEFIPFGLREVGLLILRVDRQQKYRKRFVMKVINYPDATALSSTLGSPANFPDAASLRYDVSGLRVRANECDQLQPFVLGEQASRLPKEKWRLDHRHRRWFHCLYYTLKAHASCKRLWPPARHIWVKGVLSTPCVWQVILAHFGSLLWPTLRNDGFRPGRE